MKKHPTTVEGFDGSLKVLAQRIARMRYDKVAKFLYYFAEELMRQSNNDMRAKRARLAILLTSASGMANALRQQLEKIFFLCAPHMRHEVGKKPKLGYEGK